MLCRDRRALLCALASTLFLPNHTARAQEDVAVPRSAQIRYDRNTRVPTAIRTEVKLVLIPVSVTDPYQRPVLDLKTQNFRLFDEGAEQKISKLSLEEEPVSVGMVFDASYSMRNKLRNSREALAEFLRTSTPGDEFSLWKFGSRPEPVCLFTMDDEEIQDNLSRIQPQGYTSLFDALYLALNQMKRASRATKALLVLSDGGDNNSRYTEREIRTMVREADVRIFSISIMDRSPVLERISDESGGRAYRVHKLDELTEMATRLSAEIHSRYVLGYRPQNAQNDGKYHRVTVKLVPGAASGPLHLAWRHGYYARLP
ncbi:MAG: VWA domain-containing protein [Bryobacteraceae bacterium]